MPTVLVASVLSASPASATHSDFIGGLGCWPTPYNPGAINWTSMRCMDGVTMYGSYGEWHRNHMWLRSDVVPIGWQVAHMLVAHTGAPCGLTYLRHGLTRGTPNGLDAYAFFIAEVDTLGNYLWFNMGDTTWDGGNNSYYIRYGGATASGGRYDVFKDGIGWDRRIYTTLWQGFGTCRALAGLAVRTQDAWPDERFLSDTFDMMNLQWQNTAYQFQVGWFTADLSIDSNCPTHPSPYCFNGALYSPTRWSDNLF